MQQIATITGKMQLTVPISIARKIGLKSGEKISISEENGKIVITPMKALVEELAGSLSIPKKWEGKTMDEVIEEAKEEYFRDKYSKSKNK